MDYSVCRFVTLNLTFTSSPCRSLKGVNTYATHGTVSENLKKVEKASETGTCFTCYDKRVSADLLNLTSSENVDIL